MSAIARLLLGFAMLSVAACAARPPGNDPDAQAEYKELNDPLEPTNRFFYRVNDTIDTYALRPAAVAYRDVVPGAVGVLGDATHQRHGVEWCRNQQLLTRRQAQADANRDLA